MLFAFMIFFSLVGVFGFLRHHGMPTLGFLVFMLPICMAAIYTLFLQPIVAVKSVKVFFHIANRSAHQKVHAVLLVLYFVIMAIGFARSIDLGTRNLAFGVAEICIFLVIPIFFYAVIITSIQNESYSLLLKGIVISMFLYLVINIVGAILGINANVLGEQYKREFKSLFGFTEFRIIFPFNQSGQLLSISAGIVFTYASLHLFGNRRWRDLFMVWCMIAVSLVILFGHSARGPIMVIPSVIMLSFVWKYIRRFLGFYVVTITVVSPLIFTYTRAGEVLMKVFLAWSGLPLVRSVNASTPLSNREIIWDSVFYEFSSFRWVHMIGFGAYGQITSRIIDMFAFLFSHSYISPYKASVHNSYLQILVDYGYIGFILFISIVLSLCALVSKSDLGNRKALAMVLVYLLITSILETSLTYYSIESWSIFVFLNIYVLLGSQGRNKTELIL